jgi:arsenical pump membrane protein
MCAALGLPEAVASVPAALLVVAFCILPAGAAMDQLRSLAPTIGFLAAVLVLGELSDRESLFAAAGSRMARAAGAGRWRCWGWCSWSARR